MGLLNPCLSTNESNERRIRPLEGSLISTDDILGVIVNWYLVTALITLAVFMLYPRALNGTKCITQK